MKTLANAWERSCLLKIRHPDKGSAELAAQRMERLEREPMTIYHCPCCNGWHIAHQRRISK